jgi:hypothetical protein
MHSLIFLLSEDKNYEDLPDEDGIADEFNYADYVALQDKKELPDDIKWLSEQFPQLHIKDDNSFSMPEDVLNRYKDVVRDQRKKEIQSLLDREPLSLFDLWEVSRAAYPETGMQFKYESDCIMEVESWILDIMQPYKKYYIIQSYDYHF